MFIISPPPARARAAIHDESECVIEVDYDAGDPASLPMFLCLCFADGDYEIFAAR